MPSERSSRSSLTAIPPFAVCNWSLVWVISAWIHLKFTFVYLLFVLSHFICIFFRYFFFSSSFFMSFLSMSFFFMSFLSCFISSTVSSLASSVSSVAILFFWVFHISDCFISSSPPSSLFNNSWILFVSCNRFFCVQHKIF